MRPAFRLGLRLLPIAPNWLGRWLAATTAGPALAWHEGLRGDAAALLGEVARAVDVPFLKWAARAIVTWQGTPEGDVACPVFHLHGGRDRVIPPGQAGETETIPDGRHLVNLTHPAQANAFLARHTPRPPTSTP